MAALRRDETGPIHTKSLVIPIAYPFEQPRAGEEPFAMSRIPSVTLGWRGFLCRLPDFSGPAPDLASLAHEFGSGRPPQWPMGFVDTGRWRWTPIGCG